MTKRAYMTDHCPACGARLKPARPEYPAAERLHIQYVGRMLYAIAGKAGLSKTSYYNHPAGTSRGTYQ